MPSTINTPLEREPVEIEPRKMTAGRRARIIAKHNGQCAYPDCEETAGLEVDHIVALALGGKDHDDNLEPLCEAHHSAKTRRDLGLIAKAKRLNLAHTGQKPPPTRKLKGRGFQRRWGDLAP